MHGIALKIFFGFWIIHAVLFAVFALTRDVGGSVRFQDHVKQHGAVAAALLEGGEARRCQDFSAALERQAHLRLILFDASGAPVCASPSADVAVFVPYVPGRTQDVLVSTATADVALVTVHDPTGKAMTAAGESLPGFEADAVRPAFPYRNVALAVIVSGLVCFVVARYLARPLRQVRDVSYRLAAGDLQARVGQRVGVRRDEVGDLVRDFDSMAGRLEALVHSQSQLLWDISHELRSPLARLNVALELARRKSGPDARVDLDRIEAEATRMNELIGRVLALARAESDRAGGREAPVDLSAIVRQVTEDADYEAQRRQRAVVVAVAASPIVIGHAELIASAVDNVVRNAVRYTPEHSTVDVRLTSDERGACITVRDHGPGVPPAEIERIFSPFHRVDAAHYRGAGGVGLGLAIARRAVAVHRGTITADNAPDGGLVVTIRLPIDTSLPNLDPS